MLHPTTSLSRTIFLWIASLLCIATGLYAQSMVGGDGFDPNANGLVISSARQSDGKIIIAGNFTTLQPNGATTATVRNRIARLNPDGSLDESFDPNADGQINSVVLQSDGRILIGGSFTTLQPKGTPSAVAKAGLARLNADGSLDASFNAGIVGEFKLATKVYVLSVQLDGRVLVGGEFVAITGTGASASFPRKNFARLNSDGSLDTSFVADTNNVVKAIALQRDGSILVGGGFTTIKVSSASTAETRNRIARLSSAGAIDTSFNPNANNLVAQIVVQPNGRILIAGNFTTLQPNGADSTTTRNYIARLNTDGTIDSDFNPNPNGAIQALFLQSNGRILVGGSFSSAQPNGSATTVTTSYLARFMPDGNIDTDFVPGANYTALTFLTLPDNKIVVGGYFTSFRPQNTNSSFPRNYIARLNSDGVLDVDLQSGASGTYYTAVITSNGDMLVGGSFSNIGGVTVHNLARIKSTGEVDTSFSPVIDSTVQSIAVQSDGKIIIGGAFTSVNDTDRYYIARIDSTGALDTSFNPCANAAVTKIVVQNDGKILLGGSFTTFQPNSADSSTVRTYLARLNADGSLDTAFDPSPSSTVNDIYLQSNGQMIIGGYFTSVSPTGSTAYTRYYLARLNGDGTVDAGFDIRCDSSVSVIAMQSDDKMLLAGSFTGVYAKNATAYVTRNRLARLNSDFTLDTTFNPNANGSVTALQVVDGGKIAIAGSFTTLDPNDTDATDEDTVYDSRKYIAVLNSDGTVTDFNLSPNGTFNKLLYVSADRLYALGNFTGFQTGSPASWTYVPSFARLTTSGKIDTSFAPGVLSPNGGAVYATAVERSGTYLLGGKFSGFAGSTSQNLVRLTHYGVADSTYVPNPDGKINAIVLPPANIDASVVSGRYAWLLTDGRMRNTVNQPRLVGRVSTTLVQQDGKVLVGGLFVVQGNVSYANLIRLNRDGSLDTTFNPAPNGEVLALAEQTHHEIVVGGSFTTMCGSTRNYAARLNPDGTLDSFDPSPSTTVYSVAVMSDGKVLIGGNFTTVQPNSATSTTTRNYLARMNADGSLDTAFDPSPNGLIQSIVPQGDKVIIGGSFTTVQPNSASSTTSRTYIARINADGTLDTSFDPCADNVVQAMVLQTDGKLVVGGQFTTFQPNSADSTTSRNYLARINTDGTLDADFNPDPNSTISALALQSDGKILVGGSFTEIASQRRNRVARITSSGAIDNSFNPDADGTVLTLAVASDASVIVGGSFSCLRFEGEAWVGGSFTSIGGAEASNLALLNTDGTLNTSNLPNPDGEVFALLRQPDGKIIVGGQFTKIYGKARKNLARLNADGTLDSSFVNDVSGAVYALAAGSDGSVYVGGAFTTIGNTARSRLARLNAAGTVDSSYNPGPDKEVVALQATADGGLWVGGSFATIGGKSAPFLALLNSSGSAANSISIPAPSSKVNTLALHANGKLVIGGEFTKVGAQTRNRLARLNADGSLDSSFDPGADAAVHSLTLGFDGKVHVGGAFSKLRGRAHPLFGRIAADAQADYFFTATVDMLNISWETGGSAPQFTAVEVEISDDSFVWKDVGMATRKGSSTVWEYKGIQPPFDPFFIRLRGWVGGTQFGSGHFCETVYMLSFLPLPSLQIADTAIATADASFSLSIGKAEYGITYSAQGLPAGLSINPITGLVSGRPLSAGTYSVVYRVSNGSSAYSYLQTIIVTSASSGELTPVVGDLRLSNLSARVQVPTSGSVSVGFVLSGSLSKPMVMRAVGPGLSSFGVTGTMTSPRLQLYGASGASLLQNQGWGGSADLVAAFNRVGAFALASSSADSAAETTLASGLYTMRIADASGKAGTVLAELFDGDTSVATQLVNLSVQGPVIAGSQQLMGGFVLTGSGLKRVLIRGIGPGLSAYGVSGALADPAMSVYNYRGELVAKNDNWETQVPVTSSVTPSSSAVVKLVATKTGAFALASGSKDAALVLELPAGVYTIGVESATSTSGTAMLEVYLVP